MINYYIDEAGSFTRAPSDQIGKWNTVAAISIPKPDERKCEKALRLLKTRSSLSANDEWKLKQYPEENYIRFLKELKQTNLLLFGVGTDAATQSASEIAHHRDTQAGKVTEHQDKLIDPRARQSLHRLADQIRSLSPQLYLQMMAQSELIYDVLEYSILYYVQRLPKQLNGFRWRADQKSLTTDNFEETSRTVLPPFLQEKSFRRPSVHVRDFDYSAMSHFFFAKDEEPTYLRDTYGLDVNLSGGLKVHKIIWDDFKFVDSKDYNGVQIADLLASGLRRCLRGGFSDNDAIAAALGGLMPQRLHNDFPLLLLTLTENATLEPLVYSLSYVFRANQRTLLL